MEQILRKLNNRSYNITWNHAVWKFLLAKISAHGLRFYVMKMQRGISGGFDLTGGHLYLWELGKRSS